MIKKNFFITTVLTMLGTSCVALHIGLGMGLGLGIGGISLSAVRNAPAHEKKAIPHEKQRKIEEYPHEHIN